MSRKGLDFYLSRIEATGGTTYLGAGAHTDKTIAKFVCHEDTVISAVTERVDQADAAVITPGWTGGSVTLAKDSIITSKGVFTAITITSGSILCYNEDPAFLSEHIPS